MYTDVRIYKYIYIWEYVCAGVGVYSIILLTQAYIYFCVYIYGYIGTIYMDIELQKIRSFQTPRKHLDKVWCFYLVGAYFRSKNGY